MPTQNNKLYRLDEFARLPITRTDEAAEYRQAVERAESKGNRAHELLNECLPDPELVEAFLKDFERGNQ